MKIAHFASREKTGALDLTPGFYMLEDEAGIALEQAGICITAPTDEGDLKPFTPQLDWNGKRLLIVRSGGIGDLLFITPALRQLKWRWPHIRIGVACLPHNAPVLFNNPDVDDIVKYPVSLQEFRRFQAQVSLEKLIEEEPLSRIVPSVDLVAQQFGIELNDRRMRYVPHSIEVEWAKSRYPRASGVKRVGIQLMASAAARTWPAQNAAMLVQLLLTRGREVFLFGTPGSIELPSEGRLYNLTEGPSAPDIRQSAAIMTTCDAMVTPDSSLCHIAGALEIPTIALYGPFPWQVRTTHQRSVQAINGHGDCAPCYHHQRPGGATFPQDGPCARTQQCEVLRGIAPERVEAKVDKILRSAR